MTTRTRVALLPWCLLGAAVVLGLVEADRRIDVLRRGYRVEALRVVRERLREDERVLRIDLAGEQRAAEARQTPEAGTPARSE